MRCLRTPFGWTVLTTIIFVMIMLVMGVKDVLTIYIALGGIAGILCVGHFDQSVSRLTVVFASSEDLSESLDLSETEDTSSQATPSL